MGLYDSVRVPCPRCGLESEFQSKSGLCGLVTYKLDNAPREVLLDVNRHAPNACRRCGTLYEVEMLDVKPVAKVVRR